MSFKIGNTSFGFTMRVPDSDEKAVDDLLSAHANWMTETHSLEQVDGKLHQLQNSHGE